MQRTDISLSLAALSAALVDACGGLVSAAAQCDVSKSQLARATDPDHPYTLKASTVWHLEQACGQPLMSRGLLDLHQLVPRDEREAIYIGVDLAGRTSALVSAVARYSSDGRFTTYEHRSVIRQSAAVRTWLARLARACSPCRAKSGASA
ncbi:MAG: hypothetical protein WBF53_05095 [Litorimonas sp.]